MQLDVIVPTYNRHYLLKRALQSLLAAELPAQLNVKVTIVDNNSRDETSSAVDSFKPGFQGRLHYMFEPKPGKSYALNTGIAATSGELVGMIDDDEEIDRSWFVRIHEVFANNDVDFVGGPYVPRWGAPPPPWLPSRYSGVIGAFNLGAERRPYGADTIMPGGNAVVRRSTLKKLMPYSTILGPHGDNYLADEDTEMYLRLIASGAKGLYLPDLIVYHYIHPERLTKPYYRHWCFHRGVSSGILDRKHRKEVPYFLGVPRYLFGRAARATLQILKTVAPVAREKENPSEKFSSELSFWDLAGFFYGKHFYRITEDFKP
jgi:glycosyltransferase involved in cell wall biosynthesis